MPISPTQDQLQTSLRSFLLAVLPAGVDVIIAIENRVPESAVPNFVIISPPRYERSDTNIDTYADVRFTGSIAAETASVTASIAPATAIPNVMPSGVLNVTAVGSGTLVVGGSLSGTGVAAGTQITAQLSGAAGGIGTYSVNFSQLVPSTTIAEVYGLMTVSVVSFGTIAVGAPVFGVGVTTGSTIKALGTGSGGVGTYAVSPSQTVGSETLAAGGKILQQNMKAIFQVDFHSGDNTAPDMAQICSTTLRDSYGVDLFAAQSPNYGVVPLYADDPKFMPFLNEAAQIEWRYLLDVYLQCNQSVVVPCQFMDEITPVLVDVETAYTP